MSHHRHSRPPTLSPAVPAGLAIAATVLAGAAGGFQAAARRAERRNPPVGDMIEVDGVRLHHHVAGRGPDLVFLHGNGAMVQDMLTSPLHAMLARRYRVHLFDRPGFGHSARPSGRPFTPEAQGELFFRALRKLGLARPVLVGHSWGTLPALALALDHPGSLRALVLMSGYLFPPTHAGDRMARVPEVPVLSDLVRSTVSPVVARLVWRPLIERVFGPGEETAAFHDGFPKGMALRPSQLRAAAEETRAMVPAAGRLSRRLPDLSVPLVIVAGEADRLVSSDEHSVRLHDTVPGSRLHLVGGAGHMVHHTAPERVLAAIDEAAAF
jgi:pimeloyl-ACP methyl ester carboxylesterase